MVKALPIRPIRICERNFGNKIMILNILDIMESTEEEVQKYMEENKIPTLAALVKKYHKAVEAAKEKPKDISQGQAPSTRKQAEKAKLKAYGQRFSTDKAHGGYVKKYAKGGGVRKVRT